MEISITKQSAALAAAFVLGFALGFVYDLLRPIRRNGGKMTAAAIDVSFALLSGTALFLFAMGADSGKLGIWELSASFLGFLVYTYTLSDLIFPLLASFYRFVSTVYDKARRRCSDFEKCLKKTFKNPTK